MKKCFLLFLLCITLSGSAWQIDSSSGLPGQKDTSMIIDRFTGPTITEEDANRNINNILALQKERRTREKKAAIVRIAIGAGLLVLLVIGLMRRKRISGLTEKGIKNIE